VSNIKIEIEKGIPIPQKRGRHGWISCLIKKMEIGDSFFVTCDDKKARSVRTSVRIRSRALQIPCTTRSVDGGIRVWRVESFDE